MVKKLRCGLLFISLFLVFLLLSCSNDSNRNDLQEPGPPSGWFKSNGLSKGVFFALAADPTDPNIIYAASSTLSVHKTTNGGGTWTPANLGLPKQPVLSLFVDPINPVIIYAAVAGGGVFVTRDGGERWQGLNQGLSQTDARAVVYHPRSPPSGLQVVSGDTTNTLNWNAVPNATAYRIYSASCAPPCTSPPVFNTTKWFLISTADLQFIHSDLNNNGTSHYYVVSAIVDGLESPVSSRVSAVPTAKLAPVPDGVAVTAGNNHNIIRWNAITTGAATYSVYKSPIPGITKNQTTGAIEPPASKIAGPISNLSFTDASALNGSPAYYVVTATQNGIESNLSAEVSAVPGPMTALFVGTGGGVFASGPAGEFRGMVNTGLAADGLDISALVLDPRTSSTNPPTLYAGTRGGVFRSTDGGQNWIAYNDGLTQSAVLSLSLVSTSGTLHAGTSAGVFKRGLGSAQWEFLGNPTLAITSLAIDPADPQTLYATSATGGILKSADGGASWQVSNQGLTVNDIRSILIGPEDRSLLYAGGVGIVFKSSDGGGQWTPIDIGSLEGISNLLEISLVRSLVSTPGVGSPLYAGGSFGVFKSADQGKGWAPMNIQLSSREVRALVVHPTRPATLYAAFPGDGIYKSLDGGGIWRAENGPATAQIDKNVASLVIDPNPPSRLYAGTSGFGVFRGEEGVDGHLSWSPATEGLTSGGILSLTIVPGSPTTLYAGTFQNGIFKLIDDGFNTWVSVGAGSDLSDKSIFALAIHPQNSSILFAGTSTGLYQSGDGGARWLLLGDLRGEEIHFITFDPTNDPAGLGIYVGTASGVFKSTDGGDRWTHLNDGMTNSVFSILVDPQQNHIVYAGTVSTGLFKRIN